MVGGWVLERTSVWDRDRGFSVNVLHDYSEMREGQSQGSEDLKNSEMHD